MNLLQRKLKGEQAPPIEPKWVTHEDDGLWDSLDPVPGVGCAAVPPTPFLMFWWLEPKPWYLPGGVGDDDLYLRINHENRIARGEAGEIS